MYDSKEPRSFLRTNCDAIENLHSALKACTSQKIGNTFIINKE